MKKISYWAKKNPGIAWVLIAGAHFGLAWLAFLLSQLLLQSGIEFNGKAFFTILVFFVPLALFYPAKKKYYARKTFDLALTLQGFILFTILFNTNLLQKEHYRSAYSAIGVTDSSVFKYKASEKILTDFQKNHQKLSKKDGRTLRKELKFQSKKWIHQNNKSQNDKTGEIIAIILLAILISMGVLLLACAIGCGGAEVLAAIVAIGGIVAVIWLTVVMINRVNRKKREEAIPKQKT
ncbi:MAG TPA: hypothetical protein VK166_19455 [Chitinophagaceae bacterium]|nr:hypothetical protein [Chitinophagaceae bacterium]